MDRLVKLISNASSTRGSDNDDFADRLSSRYTVVLLVTFAVLVGLNQWVRNPITCWTPNHFSGSHGRYTSRYCWIRNTYYLPWDNQLPPPEQRFVLSPIPKEGINHFPKRQMVTYYQWVPLILLCQAFMFYAPTLVWRAFNSKAGIDADSILAAALKVAHCNGNSRDKMLTLMTRLFDRFLGSRRHVGSRCGCGLQCLVSAIFCRMCGRRVGCYLLALYLFSKVLYIVNAVGQLFLLNSVLNLRYNTFGIDMVGNILSAQSTNYDWTEDMSYVAFPRVTFCDMLIRGQDAGNIQPYTVQCVLPINAYNEKIYTFLWFWMIVIALASSTSLVLWIVRAAMPTDKLRFVVNHLIVGERISVKPGPKDREMMRKFTSNYLQQDGSFLLRLIAHNTDNITTTELICSLWDGWKENYLVSANGSPTPDSGNHSTSDVNQGHNDMDKKDSLGCASVF